MRARDDNLPICRGPEAITNTTKVPRTARLPDYLLTMPPQQLLWRTRAGAAAGGVDH